jgi:hypothetical protein
MGERVIDRNLGPRHALARLLVGAQGLVLAGAVSAAPPPAPTPPPFPAPAPAAVPTGPSPHVKFDATEVDLGEVTRGQDAVATFTYHNTGDAPLKILSAKPG